MEFSQQLQEQIDSLLKDELLQDIPRPVTIEVLDTLISIEQGDAFNIRVDRHPLAPIVSKSSTLGDIKRHIRLKLEQMEKAERKGRQRRISWKYIWRSYCLMLDNQKLLDNSKKLTQLNIRQNAVLKFSRLSHEKGHHQKAWHWA
ncbi:hypothetical protein BDB01DRAFT_847478 [Pilobolus umbonatus]|nr:hypothetical protein BDB01DRAFT_847478 [Pilobolus umbonatus]